MKIDKHQVFSPHLARKYWSQLRAKWVEAGGVIESSILKIEDPLVRHLVAMIVDACSSGRGAYALVEAPEGFAVEEVELDDEVIDEILMLTDGDTTHLDVAYDWIVRVLKGMPAPFVAWAFGELILREEVVHESGEKLRFFAFDRVVYSLDEHRIVGVHTHPSFSHPKNKIVPIRL